MEDTRALCLAGIVLLSLVLPLTASGRPRSASATVWKGQLLASAGGLLALVPALHPAVGLAIALSAVAYFWRGLLRTPS